jgi:hypothetical protein
MPGFAFVMNLANLPVSPTEVSTGHVLRQANEAEVDSIKRVLLRVYNDLGAPFMPWEMRIPHVPGPIALLENRDDWRYFGIAFQGNDNPAGANAGIVELGDALEITGVELEIAFTLIDIQPQAESFAWNGFRLFQLTTGLLHRVNDFFLSPTVEEIAEISSVNLRLRTYSNSDLLDIRDYARRLGELKTLPSYSYLRFLGYFSILESLLTHNPNPNDPNDSLTRQVVAKTALLNNRFDRRLDYSPFGAIDHKKLWTLLYGYRSKLAHGDKAKFDDGEFRPLKNAETATLLVKETIKSILKLALGDPQLVVDLRKC